MLQTSEQIRTYVGPVQLASLTCQWPQSSTCGVLDLAAAGCERLHRVSCPRSHCKGCGSTAQVLLLSYWPACFICHSVSSGERWWMQYLQCPCQLLPKRVQLHWLPYWYLLLWWYICIMLCVQWPRSMGHVWSLRMQSRILDDLHCWHIPDCLTHIHSKPGLHHLPKW